MLANQLYRQRNLAEFLPDGWNMFQKINIDQIRRDGGTQPRCCIDATVAGEYGKALTTDTALPPVTVFYDGIHYWLADGFHRVDGAVSDGIEAMEADITSGSREDAQWYSYSANKHEKRLPRTNADKIRAVDAALKHPLGAGMSNYMIAAHVGVHPVTVLRRRKKLCSDTLVGLSEKRRGRDGRVIEVSKIQGAALTDRQHYRRKC